MTGEKRNNLSIGSSDFISLNRLKTDFCFQGVSDVLMENFFLTSKGYVSATPGDQSIGGGTNYIFNYVYNYTDHLGNIRLSYTKDPVSGDLEIMEENHYYPFGLKHSVYATGPKQKYQLVEEEENMARPGYVYKTDYNYKYNGKEWQDELGLNWYDYEARNYDPALGRWMNMDPLAEQYRRWSPYNYAVNNPVVFTDPDGMSVQTDFYNLKGQHVKHVDDGKTDKKMVLTTSKDSKEVDKAIESGHVMNQITEGDVDKMDGIYAFAGSDKAGTEQGFMFGQNGESSKVVTGDKAGEINTPQWNEAKADLASKGDIPASDVHLHPFKYDKSGNLVEYGQPDPSGPDKDPKNNKGYTQPSIVLGFEEIEKSRPANQLGGSKEYDYVPKIGFYNTNGTIIKIKYSDLKSALKKINKAK